MKMHRLLMLAALLVAAAPSFVQAQAAPATLAPGAKYSAQGADTCLECHDKESESASYVVNAIFRGGHGRRGHAKSPFARGGLQCEACHGPGANHAAKGSNKKATTVAFRAGSILAVPQRNAICLGCHQERTRNAWHAGAHERSDVACTDCHRMHADGGDRVLAKQTQAEVCYGCHEQQRADFQKPSSHPVRFGKMACSDCHSAHGSPSHASLAKPTTSQSCTGCHADKRGPLLWEHAPVAEDCTNCHTAHGSVRTALLSKPTPLLCQQCHSAQGHPSVPRTAAALPGGGGGGSIFVVAGSCTNCHTQVHGSNHPAGRKLMR